MDSGVRRLVVDAVTISRVPVAVALPLVSPRRRIWLFGLGAATDAVDGRLARRWDVASDRGARLDTVADAVFVAGSALASLPTIDRRHRRWIAAGAAVVTATRLLTFVETHRRFARWSIMHTWSNKATGLALVPVVLVALARGRMSTLPLAAVGLLAEVAAIEELAIVTTSCEYERDRSGIRRRA